jgi:hypothetical protein
MSSVTPNLGFTRQANGELVDEQIEFNGNYDLIDAVLATRTVPRFQKRYLNFWSSPWPIPANFGLNPSDEPFKFDLAKRYYMKALLFTKGNQGARFQTFVASSPNLTVETFNADKSTISGVLDLPVASYGSTPSGVADAYVFNPVLEKSYSSFVTTNASNIISSYNSTTGTWLVQGTNTATGAVTVTLQVLGVPIVVGSENPIQIGDRVVAATSHSSTTTGTLKIDVRSMNSFGFFISSQSYSGLVVTGGAGFVTSNSSGTAITIPANTSTVDIHLTFTLNSAVAGTPFGVSVKSTSLFAGTTLPSIGVFSRLSAATAVYDFMPDEANSLASVARSSTGGNTWAIARNVSVSNTNLTLVQGLIEPSSTSYFPISLLRERVNTPAYLQAASIVIEEI